MNRFDRAQAALAGSGVDGWLLYDFRHSNPVFWDLLGQVLHSTRRVYALVRPAGPPVLLVHHVDAGHFPAEGVELRRYRTHTELAALLQEVLASHRRVAMEYSPMGALPVASFVDAGTLELVRSFGVEVVSSADLAQLALCRLSGEEIESHRRAAGALSAIVREAFGFIGERLDGGVDEHQVADFIRERFGRASLWTDEGPIVAVNAHASDPHYAPTPATALPIRRGDWVLIDLWAKEPDGIFADLTWVGYAGDEAPEAHRRVFQVVTGARDAAVDFLRREAAAGRHPQGCDVDRVARAFIAGAGFGEQFTHRLGHSLGAQVHGYGASLDGFETVDTRRLLPGLAFTIEPGVYLPDFGVRSEIDVLMTETGPEVTCEVQRDIVLIVH